MDIRPTTLLLLLALLPSTATAASTGLAPEAALAAPETAQPAPEAAKAPPLPAAVATAGTILETADGAEVVTTLDGQRRVVFHGRTYIPMAGRYVDEAGMAWLPIQVTTTAYSPTVEQCDGDPHVTARGTDAFSTYGIAADPRALPYGSALRIPGYGDFPVDDTGGRMRRSWESGVVHLDLRIPLRRYDGVWRSASEATRVAMRHGVRRDRVVLLRAPWPAFDRQGAPAAPEQRLASVTPPAAQTVAPPPWTDTPLEPPAGTVSFGPRF